MKNRNRELADALSNLDERLKRIEGQVKWLRDREFSAGWNVGDRVVESAVHPRRGVIVAIDRPTGEFIVACDAAERGSFPFLIRRGDGLEGWHKEIAEHEHTS